MGKAPPPTPDPVAALAASDVFSDAQRATLRALCDTFIPALEPPAGDEDQAEFWGRAASDLAVPEGLEVALLGAGLADEQTAGLRSLLDQLAADDLDRKHLKLGVEQLVRIHDAAGAREIVGTSVANPWGELHSTPGVWIGDASGFPTASGTNPMATIMALARRTAHAIAG